MLSLGIHAQDYLTFPDSLATWNVSQYKFDFNDFTNEYSGINFHIEGDTLFNDTTYSKLYVRQSYYNLNGSEESYTIETNPYILLGGVREDSSKKVWFRNMNFDNWESDPWPESYFSLHYFYIDGTSPLLDNINESNEVMLYDFGLQVGDSLFLQPDYQLYEPYYGIVEEVSIDIVGRKTIKFGFPDCFEEQCGRIWVEGIGEVNSHPFSLYDTNEIFGLVAEYGNNLDCFWVNGEQIYTDGETEYLTNCENFIVGVQEIEKQSLEIYPNPSNGIFQIKLPVFQKSKVIIYNAVGELVKEINEIQGEFLSIDFNGEVDGFYYVVISNINGLHGKINSAVINKQ